MDPADDKSIEAQKVIKEQVHLFYYFYFIIRRWMSIKLLHKLLHHISING